MGLSRWAASAAAVVPLFDPRGKIRYCVVRAQGPRSARRTQSVVISTLQIALHCIFLEGKFPGNQAYLSSETPSFYNTIHSSQHALHALHYLASPLLHCPVSSSTFTQSLLLLHCTSLPHPLRNKPLRTRQIPRTPPRIQKQPLTLLHIPHLNLSPLPPGNLRQNTRRRKQL